MHFRGQYLDKEQARYGWITWIVWATKNLYQNVHIAVGESTTVDTVKMLAYTANPEVIKK